MPFAKGYYPRAGALPRADRDAAARGATAALAWLARPAAGLPVLLTVAVISGLLSGIALATTVVVVVFAGFRRGYNPDTLVGPLVTTAGDVFGMAALLIAARLVIWGVG